MNTSHGNAVLRPSHRPAFASVAMNWARISALLVVLGLMVGMARAAAVNPGQPIRMDGMELFFGFVPAEILRGHPKDHEEQSMHGGIPRGKGTHHLIVSVFDARTSARVTNAAVTGSVTEVGMTTQNLKLEVMSFGNAVSYGNYFSMPNQGPYEVVVNVRRAGEGKAATARFQYWHPRR